MNKTNDCTIRPSNLFMVVKKFYGDFDISMQATISGSTDRSIAQAEVDRLNAKRTPQEIREEVKYILSTVKNLDVR
jgi:hypothetical protein